MTGSSENVGISNKSHDSKVEDILYTMPSDLTTERVDTIEEVVYDMLESNPKRDSTIFSPPDANSLRPIINIVSSLVLLYFLLLIFSIKS